MKQVEFPPPGGRAHVIQRHGSVFLYAQGTQTDDGQSFICLSALTFHARVTFGTALFWERPTFCLDGVLLIEILFLLLRELRRHTSQSTELVLQRYYYVMGYVAARMCVSCLVMLER